MKKTLLAVILALGAVSAFAETEMADVLNSSYTYHQVAVSSAVLAGGGSSLQLLSAQLVGAATSFTTLMENRKVLELCNEDATANMRCLVALSSTSAAGDLSLPTPAGLGTSYGKKIAAGACYILGLRARDLDGRVFVPFCVNDSGTASAKMGVIQGRNK